MVGKSDAQRKQAERERKATQGLHRVEFWLTAAEKSQVELYVLRLLKKTRRTEMRSRKNP